MEYKCPKCNAVLINLNNKFVCEYCKSEYDLDYFSSAKTYDYIIPFEIDKSSAFKIYNQNIKSRLLTPRAFKKNIDIQSVYIPCYLYNLECAGEVDFEGNKTSTWKSSGVKYKKLDTYKMVRGGDLSIKDMLISSTTDIDNTIISFIEPYDYSKKIKYDNTYLDNYKLYDSDMTKEKLIESIKDKSKNFFIKEMQKDINEYSEVHSTNSFINFHNSSNTKILVPLFILNVNYKNNNYNYIINGQTGNFYGDIPINKNRTLIIWLLLFIIIFILLLLLSIAKVTLW